ncbi:MAG: MarR family transcriptional regulator [Bacteroidota bacterium]
MEKCDSKYCGCLYNAAATLARNMTKLADEAFSDLGMTASYAFLLMTVNEKPGVQPSEICQHLQLTPSTVTRLIEKMEYKGLLKRKKVGRSTEVYPTKKSIQLQPKIKAAWKSLSSSYTKILGKEDSKVLVAAIYAANKKLAL